MSSTEVVYRPLAPRDLNQLKELHVDFFPVRYDDQFFTDCINGIGTMGDPLFTVLATTLVDNREVIIGFIITQFQPTEESDIDQLFDFFHHPEEVCYILTLGVRREFRRGGYAKKLMKYVFSHCRSNERCGLIYLHTLSTNLEAVRYYQSRKFFIMQEFQNFYSFGGKNHSSYLLAHYIDPYVPPVTFRMGEYVSPVVELLVDNVNYWAQQLVAACLPSDPIATSTHAPASNTSKSTACTTRAVLDQEHCSGQDPAATSHISNSPSLLSLSHTLLKGPENSISISSNTKCENGDDDNTGKMTSTNGLKVYVPSLGKSNLCEAESSKKSPLIPTSTSGIEAEPTCSRIQSIDSVSVGSSCKVLIHEQCVGTGSTSTASTAADSVASVYVSDATSHPTPTADEGSIDRVDPCVEGVCMDDIAITTDLQLLSIKE